MKKYLIGLLVLFSLTACTNNNTKSLRGTIKKALELAESNKPDEGLTLLDTAIKKYPDYYYLYYLKGKIQFDEFKFNDAIKDLNQAIIYNDTDFNCYLLKAGCFEKISSFDSSVLYYSKALLLIPTNTIALNNRGLIYLNKNEIEKAIEDFTIAIKYDSSSAESYNNLGLAFDNKGSHKNAVDEYSLAIKLKKDYKFFYNRGIAYFNLNEVAFALEDFNQSIKLNDTAGIVYINRGMVYIKMNKKDLACSDFAMALAFKESNAASYLAEYCLDLSKQ